MASNSFATFEDYASSVGAASATSAAAYVGPDGDPRGPGYAGGEWDPRAEDFRPSRRKHRVVRPRGGSMARSRAVLGVGVMAAVGASGMATANEEGAGAVPGLDGPTDQLRSLPLVSSLLSGDTQSGDAQVLEAAPLTEGGTTEATDAGEALRARILQQADRQETAAASETRSDAVAAAESEAAQEAEERREQEEEEQREREEAERLAELRASYTLPLSDYTLSSGFGDSGSYWSSTHTGQDFAAPTGTPVKNVHTGTVTEAAWAGSYGYRVIVELEDGTEIWYCHLSSMNVSAGDEVTTGDTVGLVGSTGNSTGSHLHLEVRPDGGDPIDPLDWLRSKGLDV